MVEPNHPIFEGLNLDQGTRIGFESPVLAGELDEVPLDSVGNVDRSWPSDFPEKLRVLGTARAFVATYLEREQSMERYHGIKDVGIFVETSPTSRSCQARVLSFGSIGFVFALAAQDPAIERVFINSIRYLSRQELISSEVRAISGG